MANGNYSFENILKYYLKTLNPQNIIEWGPGKSTQIMHEICPVAHIITIEHNNKWLEIAKNKFKNNTNINILQQKIDNLCCNYATIAYKYAPFDMAFIDGRRRVECCFVAMDVINSNGVILLHDSKRISYRRIIDKYIDIIIDQDNTLVFKKKN